MYMGAGILPVAFFKGDIYFLFSRETMDRNKCVDWRDFGGTPENNETPRQTAIREGWEETMGFFGNKTAISKLIKDKTIYISKIHKKYHVYVVEVKMDKTLPKRFRQHYLEMYNKDKSKLSKNGFYEKDKLKWIKLGNLKRNKHLFTSWYYPIVLDIFDFFNKNLKK